MSTPSGQATNLKTYHHRETNVAFATSKPDKAATITHHFTSPLALDHNVQQLLLFPDCAVLQVTKRTFITIHGPIIFKINYQPANFCGVSETSVCMT